MRLFLVSLIIIVFLDTFVQFPIISPYAEELGSTSFVIGLVVGMFSLTNLAGNLFAGKWSDKFGPKLILVVGMAASVVALFLYTLVSTPTHLVIARSLHGFTSGLLTPSIFAVVASLGGNMKQGRNMAYSGAAVGLAAVIGPALGGILKAKFGIDTVFIVVGVLMLVALIAAMLFLPDTKPRRVNKVKATNNEWFVLLKHRSVIQACMGAFGLMFAMGVLTYMLPLKTQSLNFGDQSAGFMLSTFGIVAILFFVLPINKFYDRISSKLLMTNGLVTIAFALIMLAWFTDELLLYVALGVYGVGFALLFPSMNALLAEDVNEEHRGKAFGIFYAVYSIGVVVGSFVVGAVSATPAGGFQLAAGIVALFAIAMIIIRIVEMNKQVNEQQH